MNTMRRGRVREGRVRSEWALTSSRDPNDERCFWLLIDAGDFARFQGDLDRAAELHGEALAIARQMDDPERLDQAKLFRGVTALTAGDDTEARARFEELRAQAETLGHGRFMSMAVANLGTAARRQGDPTRGAEL